MKTQITNLIKWQNLLKELQETKSNIESFEVSNILEEFNEDLVNPLLTIVGHDKKVSSV